MRNISFALTTEQFRARTKTVTRRLGWEFLRAGDRLCGCVKCMGLKKGEQLDRLGVIEVVTARRERLDAIDEADVAREGFPGMAPAEFVEMFCRHHAGCKPETVVTRIEYKYTDEPLPQSRAEKRAGERTLF